MAHFVLGLVTQVTQGISGLFHLDVSDGNHSLVGRNSRANLNGYLLVLRAGIASTLGSISRFKCIWF